MTSRAAGLVTTERLVVVVSLGLLVGAVGLVMPRAVPVAPWELWERTSVPGIEHEHYGSMRGMALAADAVIVGRLKSIERGPTYGEPGARTHFASIRLHVDEVLQGSLEAGWELHHPMGDRGRVAELRRYISDGQAVYFLRSLERELEDLGFGDEEASELAGAFRLVTGGSVINDDYGEARRPLPQEGALDAIDGRGFGAVVADIRAFRR